MHTTPRPPVHRQGTTSAAGPLVRLGARAVDGIVLGAVGVAAGAPRDFDIPWLVGHAVFVYAYFVVLDSAWGTTLGKRLLGLRVAGADGRRPSAGQAAAREAFTLVGAVPFVGPLLALAAWASIGVTIRNRPSRQGWHDALAGGTRVLSR